MKKTLCSFLALVCFLVCLAQEDLQKKVFIFPTASNTAHVVLKTTPEQPLISFTVCLRSFTDLTRAHSLFSYATRRNDNELLLFKQSSNEYQLYVGNEYVSFKVPEEQTSKLGGEHICMSWESATGLVTFWLNGQPFPRKGLKKGYSISPEASIVLGQEQDSFGGGFNAKQCFVGEIEDVYMFDRVLSPNEVHLLQYSSPLSESNYLSNWRSLSYDIKGYVIVRSSLLQGN